MQALRRRPEPDANDDVGSDRAGEFDRFLQHVEPKLRVALVATYGPVDGAVALADAMSWAWEHFESIRSMPNPAGYLYRVGQSSTRRTRPRPIPVRPVSVGRDVQESTMSPHVAEAMNRLPQSQRAAVMLVHGFGWSQREVAELLGVTPSTIHQSLDRGIARLTSELDDAERTTP